jgi:hypothetical protein
VRGRLVLLSCHEFILVRARFGFAPSCSESLSATDHLTANLSNLSCSITNLSTTNLIEQRILEAVLASRAEDHLLPPCLQGSRIGSRQCYAAQESRGEGPRDQPPTQSKEHFKLWEEVCHQSGGA